MKADRVRVLGFIANRSKDATRGSWPYYYASRTWVSDGFQYADGLRDTPIPHCELRTESCFSTSLVSRTSGGHGDLACI